MVKDQCWAITADGLRCGAPSVAGDYYCIVHGFGSRPESDQIWREPVCEMPPGLVVMIRADDPDAIFPESVPDACLIATEEPSPPLMPAAPEPDRSVPPCESPGPVGSPLAWLLAALQTAVHDVMASDATPLQKANAVSRLGNLYLKTDRAAELQQENRELRRRLDELETQLVTAAAEAARRVPSASPRPDARPPAPVAGALDGFRAGSPVAAARGPASPARRHTRKR